MAQLLWSSFGVEAHRGTLETPPACSRRRKEADPWKPAQSPPPYVGGYRPCEISGLVAPRRRGAAGRGTSSARPPNNLLVLWPGRRGPVLQHPLISHWWFSRPR